MPRNEFKAGDWEDPEYEDLSHEIEPVEADPEEATATPTLADLRKESGATTTEAHIAEIKRKWADPDHIFEL